MLLENIFKQYATNIFLSESGEEARQIYQVVNIDLICLSFYLADMDGVEFVSRIRASRFGKTLPVLMITSMKSQDVTAKSMEGGVTEVFRKNSLDSLEKYLRNYAEHTRQHLDIEGNILLIDRDQQEAAEIREYFKNTKLRFVHFTAAEDAAEIARAAEFDLVMTSVVLDGSMSGMALIREIREINETMYRVPVLAISSIENASQKIELLRAGANDYIQTPILREELCVRVKNLLYSKKLFDTVELQKQQLADLATRDQLTGLYNRHHLLTIADRTILDAGRHSYPVSLLVVDLDHFKKVNDEYGHAAGDMVLKEVARLLLKLFRGGDTPVRVGGEEFVVLLPHCDGENALNRAESLRQKIASLQPSSITITASIGVSQLQLSPLPRYEDLFAAADRAVYLAKEQGRNKVVFQSYQGRPAPSEPGNTQ